MLVPPRAYPAHCPSCKKYIVGLTRTFCGHCLESVPDVHDRWYSTEEWTLLDNDANFTH